MSKDQREALLAAGVGILHERGFAATGVREIAAAANVPQGSFTNHFRSKDAFGVLVLDRYFERLDAVMRETLRDEMLSPPDRLLAYFGRITALLADADWRLGCLLVDLAAEAPMRSEALRERLVILIERQTAEFERVLRRICQDENEASDLAAFILAAWHGTLLRLKTERNAGPVERFQRVMTNLLNRSAAASA